MTVGFVLGWSRPGRYAVLIDHPNAKAPAAVNARGSEGRIRDRAAGTANAGAQSSIDIKLPSSAEARGRNMRKVRNPDHDAAGFGSTDRDHKSVGALEPRAGKHATAYETRGRASE